MDEYCNQTETCCKGKQIGVAGTGQTKLEGEVRTRIAPKFRCPHVIVAANCLQLFVFLVLETQFTESG